MNGEANGSRPNQPIKSAAKKRLLQVTLLDDTVVAFDVEPRAKGDALFGKVNTHLNLEEAEYFGLQYNDEDGNTCWLDPLKMIGKQLKEPTKVTFKFRVMFYTPDPNGLLEYTRYLFTLQVRRDLLDGRLHCSQDTGAMLASYIVQGELGDYDVNTHKEGYLSGFQFVPQQTPDVEQKIVDYHKSHRGLSPAEADHSMLEIARQLEMYGITLYPAQDSEGLDLKIAVHHMGILVFQNQHKINSFSWANVRKLSFKRRKFVIKLHTGIQDGGNAVFFTMNSRDACKNFWKVTVSHHVFFRQATANGTRRQSSLRRGSKFRYSGRTRKEISDEAGGGSKYATIESEKNRSSGVVSAKNDLSLNISQSPASVDSSQVTTPNDEAPSPSPPQYNSVVTKPYSASSVSDNGSYVLPNGESVEKLPIEMDGEEELVEDPMIPNDLSEHKVINITHQDTIDSTDEKVDVSLTLSSPSMENHIEVDEEVVVNDSQVDVECAPPSADVTVETPNVDAESGASLGGGLMDELLSSSISSDLKLDTSLDFDTTLHITSTDAELENEVSSMFAKINSEYGVANTSWQYQMTSVDASDIKSDDEDKDQAETMVNGHTNENECTEADADLSINQTTTTDIKVTADVKKDSNENIASDKTEADEETEAQLKEKVKALYLQPYMSTSSAYDSDSDASAMGVEDEESAFEDDFSLPRSKSGSMNSINTREEYMNELRKYKTSGKAYYIAKEILLTERTYVKDLEVLTVSFRSVVEKGNVLPDRLLRLLYDNVDPLYDFHCSLLAELEERLAVWESVSTVEASRDSVQKIGDIMHRNMRQIKLHTSYIQKHGEVVLQLEAEAKRSKVFEEAYKEFELGKNCYLSLNSFLLKPVQRLLYYRSMLGRLAIEYGKDHPDLMDTKVAYAEVVDACKQVESSMKNLENLHKMVELQRDLVSVEDLVHPSRKFIREGCLHKICRKGPQPRMFFLLSDILLYTSQGVTATNQFRARAQIPLRIMKVEDGGVELHGLYAFTITGIGGRSFVVAASSPEEKTKWMDDIQSAIANAIKESVCPTCQAIKTEFMLYVGRENRYLCNSCKEDIAYLEQMSPEHRLTYWQQKYPPPPTLKKNSVDADSDDEGSYSMDNNFTSLDRKHAHAKTVSTRRVCWHRNTSISMAEYIASIQNSISGELLRRFKNSNKWQKLWVVFTNFCLYFFKSHEDDAPLASLPLIGYTISKPSETECHDDYGFKLQFKTHVYFFRATNENAYERWTEVISSATRSATTKNRLYSRQGSLSSENMI